MAVKGQLPERKNKDLSQEEFTQMIKQREEEEKHINNVIQEKKKEAAKNKKKRETKKPYTLTLRPSVHDIGVELAEEEGLSFSSWLEQLIEKEGNN
jgi:predicted HicB family RNase H-like nuclease